MSRLTNNLCTADRLVRLVVGPVCLYLGFAPDTPIPNHIVAVLVGLFGVLNLFAAASSHCPVYAACGISSRPKQTPAHIDESAI